MQVLRVIGKARQVDGAILFTYSEEPQHIPAALVFARHPGGASQEPSLKETASSFSVGDRLIYRGLAYYGYIATVKNIDLIEGTNG